MRRLIPLALIAGCSTDTPTRPAPLPDLPPPAPVMTDRFRDAEACAQCHLADETTFALHDASGGNVAPVLLWRSSLMALAARDPFYLAVFAEELARAPAKQSAIETTCTRCHAPAGAEELASAGSHLAFDTLVSGTGPGATLGRGGVTCSLCHQIADTGLGDDTSFSGRFSVGYRRMMYGRYADPVASPMQLIVSYTPTLGAQIASSALCGTCHTVIVGGVVEQATFLEWRASSFAGLNQTCQSCHVPITDDAGAPISAAVARFPAGLSARQPVGRHVFVGGNSYVLSLLADGVAWSGANLDPAELTASAARDDAHLATAAKLSIVDAHREGTTLVATVRVENQTGHKLPTGYPSRRVWLHVTAGSFESGRADAIDRPQPHRDVIDAADQAQVWEAVLVDAAGVPTHRTLDATGYGKDDRILPRGFASSDPRMAPIGTPGDPSFLAGSDDVTYRIANAPAGVTLSIELLYEPLAPTTVDAIEASATSAGTRFVDLSRARPVAPVVIAHVEQTIP